MIDRLFLSPSLLYNFRAIIKLLANIEKTEMKTEVLFAWRLWISNLCLTPWQMWAREESYAGSRMAHSKDCLCGD